MPEGLSKNILKKSKRKMWAKLTSRSTFAGFENHYPGPCHVSGSENLWISFWKLVRSFTGIYQNDQGTSSLKSSAITIFVVFWQKYLKSSSSLAETHWLTVWSLGHLGPIAQAQDLRISGSQAQAQAQDCHWCLRLWKPGHSQTQMGSETWDMRHWDIGNLGELAVLGFGYWEIRI